MRLDDVALRLEHTNEQNLVGKEWDEGGPQSQGLSLHRRV